MKTRNPGYYWVKYPNKEDCNIEYWNGGMWFTRNPVLIKDEDFEYIDENQIFRDNNPIKSNDYIPCDKGWHSGECCCNCRNQLELMKHPWNKQFQGSVTESTEMYVCTVQHIMDKDYKGTILEKKHGMCELHIPK
jgi:hypothetical protein